MFIKNQEFKDEETLLEMLFDFGIGDPSPLLKEMIAVIDKELEQNMAYTAYRDSLQDEDDRIELYIEERDLVLAEKLLAQYELFEIEDKKLYAVKGLTRDLLYELNFV